MSESLSHTAQSPHRGQLRICTELANTAPHAVTPGPGTPTHAAAPPSTVFAAGRSLGLLDWPENTRQAHSTQARSDWPRCALCLLLGSPRTGGSQQQLPVWPLPVPGGPALAATHHRSPRSSYQVATGQALTLVNIRTCPKRPQTDTLVAGFRPQQSIT